MVGIVWVVAEINLDQVTAIAIENQNLGPGITLPFITIAINVVIN